MGPEISKEIPLPQDLEEKCLNLFNLLDYDNSEVITRNEAERFWAKNFPKRNSFNIFDQVDRNGDEHLTKKEWVKFWNKVANSGLSENEISTRLDNLIAGNMWERFNNLGKAKISNEEEKKKGLFVCAS